jgi:hypothetical protein
MGNWWFVLATALIAVAMPAIGRLVQPDAFRAPAKAVPARERPAPAPVPVVEPLVEGVADARS